MSDQDQPPASSGKALTGKAQGTEAMEALRGIADDYMTSESHHPGYVLIPAEKFNQLRAAAEALPPKAQGISQAARDVLAERRRQVEAEGWTPEHDDTHRKGEMARAAGCYALLAGGIDPPMSKAWPWNWSWWKQTGSRRMLVKAAALILAEIERQDRAAPPASSGQEG